MQKLRRVARKKGGVAPPHISYSFFQIAPSAVIYALPTDRGQQLCSGEREKSVFPYFFVVVPFSHPVYIFITIFLVALRVLYLESP